MYSNVSRHYAYNALLGIYIQSTGREEALLALLALMIKFLIGEDQAVHRVHYKTTMLEALAYLVVLCCDPKRLEYKDMVFYIDNLATVGALQKGYAKGDPWTSTLVRAARVVAVELGSLLFAEWIPRRLLKGT